MSLFKFGTSTIPKHLPKLLKFTAVGGADATVPIGSVTSAEGIEEISRLPQGSYLHTTTKDGKALRVARIVESTDAIDYNVLNGSPPTPPAIAALVAKFLPKSAKGKKIVVRDASPKATP